MNKTLVISNFSFIGSREFTKLLATRMNLEDSNDQEVCLYGVTRIYKSALYWYALEDSPDQEFCL